MTRFATFSLLLASLTLSGCGGDNSPAGIINASGSNINIPGDKIKPGSAVNKDGKVQFETMKGDKREADVTRTESGYRFENVKPLGNN